MGASTRECKDGSHLRVSVHAELLVRFVRAVYFVVLGRLWLSRNFVWWKRVSDGPSFYNASLNL
jgi:hypothetical protein